MWILRKQFFVLLMKLKVLLPPRNPVKGLLVTEPYHSVHKVLFLATSAVKNYNTPLKGINVNPNIQFKTLYYKTDEKQLMKKPEENLCAARFTVILFTWIRDESRLLLIYQHVNVS